MNSLTCRVLLALIAVPPVLFPMTGRADVIADCKVVSDKATQRVQALFDSKLSLLERAIKRTPDPHSFIVAGQPNETDRAVDLPAVAAKIQDARTRVLATVAEMRERCVSSRGESAHDIDRLARRDALAGALPAEFKTLEPQLAKLDPPMSGTGNPAISGDQRPPGDQPEGLPPLSSGGDRSLAYGSPVLGWVAPRPQQALAPASRPIQKPRRSGIARDDDAAAVPMPTAASDADQIDAALKRLVPGNVAFNSPDKMRLGKVQTLQVRLSTKLAPEALRASLTEDGKRESAALKVAPRMAATLSGGNAFEISPPGPQTQWISRDEATEWSWEVTPKTEGSQTIVLRLDAIFTVDGKDGPRNVTTLKHKIDVDVGWPATTGEWLAFLKKQIEDAKWLWATVLVPFGLAVLRFRRPKETPPVPPDTTGKNPAKSSS